MKYKPLFSIYIIGIFALINVASGVEQFIFDSDEKSQSYNTNKLTLELKISVTLKNYLQIKVKGNEKQKIPHIKLI